MKLGPDIAAIVVGGASGLGEGTVRRLAGLGVRCAVFDRDEARGAQVARETGARFFSCDVTDDPSVQRAFDGAKAALGAARILVNCAGIGLARKIVSRNRETGEIAGHAVDLFRRIVDINLVGTFRTMVRFATDVLAEPPLDVDGERGVIVNTASIAAQDGQQGQAAYAASKGGILAMTLPVARDLGREGIRVLTIMPGYFATPMTSHASEAARAALVENSLFPRRAGGPDEYALLVEQMCVNKMLNGECVRLDAGARLPRR